MEIKGKKAKYKKSVFNFTTKLRYKSSLKFSSLLFIIYSGLSDSSAIIIALIKYNALYLGKLVFVWNHFLLLIKVWYSDVI